MPDRSVRVIAIITKSFGVKPILIPEIWNEQYVTENYPVVPYVKERDIPKMAAHMNANLDAAASESYCGKLLLPKCGRRPISMITHISPRKASRRWLV
jgi:hypothetical protein